MDNETWRVLWRRRGLALDRVLPLCFGDPAPALHALRALVPRVGGGVGVGVGVCVVVAVVAMCVCVVCGGGGGGVWSSCHRPGWAKRGTRKYLKMLCNRKGRI